uniref:Uncharacterized protein n=1 Tax=Oryza brachyantha TaxID=4533 RepID=J3MVG3_ORYBR
MLIFLSLVKIYTKLLINKYHRKRKAIMPITVLCKNSCMHAKKKTPGEGNGTQA